MLIKVQEHFFLNVILNDFLFLKSKIVVLVVVKAVNVNAMTACFKNEHNYNFMIYMPRFLY
jgi:hypothetical protein